MTWAHIMHTGSGTSGQDSQGRLVFAQAGRAVYNGATFWGNPITDGDLFDAEDLYDTGTGRSSASNEDTSPLWTHGPFRPPPSSDLKLDGSATSQCRLCGRPYRLVCVMSMLPGQDVCTRLCEIFMASVFPVVPILHLKGLCQDLEELWSGDTVRRGCQADRVPTVLRRKPGLLCLLASMVFSTLHSTPSKILDRKLGAERPKSLRLTSLLAAMISASLTGFPTRPTLYTLAAYIFVQSQFNREEEFRMAPESITTSFRLAISMGLHRHLDNSAFSVPDRETRKRLWWYIMHLDVMASCSSGLCPIFVDDKMSNVGVIKEYDEVEGDGDLQVRFGDLRYVVAAKRYDITNEIRHILRLHFEDAYEHQASRDETLRRLERLEAQVRRASEVLLRFANSVDPSREKPPVTEDNQMAFGRTWSVQPGFGSDSEAVNFASWAAILLHMMIHKAYCTYYHPFFARADLQGSDDDQINAVKHSQSFLYLFVRLCNDPTSTPYQWMYPGTYQPLQAVSLLIADLLKRPHSDEAEASRGFIDRVFEMYSIDHGIVGQKTNPVKRELSAEGRSVWRILARARRKALSMVGEDAHILLPNPVTATMVDHCVCGERIAIPDAETARPRVSTAPGDAGTSAAARQAQQSQFPPQPFEGLGQPQSTQDETMVSGWPDTDDLIWQEFVALAGYSSGFIS